MITTNHFELLYCAADQFMNDQLSDITQYGINFP